MVTDTDNLKEFHELENKALLEKGNGELDILVPGPGSIEYSYSLTPEEDGIEVLEDDLRGGFEHRGEEVSADEINQLLEEDGITRDEPLMYRGSKMAFYGPNLADPTEKNPKLYDPEKDEFSEDGQEMIELEEFINEYGGRDTVEIISRLLKHLYDDLGMRHSTDVTDERSPGESQEPDENALEALKQGHGLCGELERIFTYTLRNTGDSAGRPFNNVLRYTREDGITVPDSDGEYVVGHGFPMVELGEDEVILDPSIYMHLRETGMSHEKATASSVDREEIYYTRNRISPPEIPGFQAQIQDVKYSPRRN